MGKSEIIKQLRKNQERIGEIADIFESTGSIDRHSQNKIVFIMFELMDSVGKVEVSIYNYLKRRGWK